MAYYPPAPSMASTSSSVRSSREVSAPATPDRSDLDGSPAAQPEVTHHSAAMSHAGLGRGDDELLRHLAAARCSGTRTRDRVGECRGRIVASHGPCTGTKIGEAKATGRYGPAAGELRLFKRLPRDCRQSPRSRALTACRRSANQLPDGHSSGRGRELTALALGWRQGCDLSWRGTMEATIPSRAAISSTTPGTAASNLPAQQRVSDNGSFVSSRGLKIPHLGGSRYRRYPRWTLQVESD